MFGDEGAVSFLIVALDELFEPEGISVSEGKKWGESIEVVDKAIELELEKERKEEASDVLSSTLEFDQLLG